MLDVVGCHGNLSKIFVSTYYQHYQQDINASVPNYTQLAIIYAQSVIIYT